MIQRVQLLLKRLGSVSIVLKLTVAATTATVVAVVASGWLSYAYARELLLNATTDSMEQSISRQVERLTTAIDRVRQDALFVSGSDAAEGVIRARATDGYDEQENLTEANWRQRLEHAFTVMIKSKGYLQIRLIDAGNGKEIVRVDRSPAGSSGVRVVRGDALQFKSGKRYVIKGGTLGVGQTYASPVSLNREHGVIEVPWKPTQRFVAPVFAGGRPRSTEAGERPTALIVINADAARLIDMLERDSRFGIILANSNGGVLRHPDPGRAWAFEFGTDDGVNRDQPVAWQALLAGKASAVWDHGGEEFHALGRIPLEPGNPNRFLGLMTVARKSDVVAEVEGLRYDAMAVSFVAVLATCTLCIVGVRQLTKPIRTLTVEACRLAAGDEDVRITVSGDDEVGKLSRTFAHLVDSLQTRTGEATRRAAEVRELNESLEEKVRLRTIELGESEQRTRAIVETAVDAIVTIDDHGVIESFNPAAERMFGYSAEHCVGRNVSMVTPSPHREQHDEYLARYMRTGRGNIIGHGAEASAVRSDGTEFPVELSVSEVVISGRRMFTGIIRDISERKMVARQLEESARDLMEKNKELQSQKEELVKQSDELGVLYDAATLHSEELAEASQTIESTNRALLAVNEVYQDLFRGESFEDVATALTNALVEKFDARFARLWVKMRGDDCSTCVLADHCADKRECLHLVSSSGFYTHTNGAHARVPVGAFKIGKIARGRGKTVSNDVAHDECIHDRAWAAEQKLKSFVGLPLVRDGETVGVLAMFSQNEVPAHQVQVMEVMVRLGVLAIANIEQLEAVRAADKAKSDFLANMSHEIRTPMTAILGFTDTLADNVAKPENVEAIATVKRNGEHLLGIINNILDLSKIESGNMTVESVACEPHRLVGDVIDLLRVRTDAKRLMLAAEFIGDIPETIQTDPSHLRQILINVVGNAIKFTQEGGVRVITRFVPDGAGSRMQFDVIDTGIGMSPEQEAILFRPFAQADNSMARRFGGTGLGLVLSRRFAEALGGDVTIQDTTPGAGTRFRISILAGCADDVPMIDGSVIRTAKKATPNVEPPRSDNIHDLRLLLAEDGEDNQRLISFVLKKAGAEVTVAENGLIATEKALAARDNGEPFDAILMDMQMPVMDGYQATARLRNEGHTGPIIALTAHAMASDRKKCIDAGCDDYATKPIDRKKLVDTILRNLSGNADHSVADDDRSDQVYSKSAPPL
jgi:PAS domain S-box-containing protein